VHTHAHITHARATYTLLMIIFRWHCVSEFPPDFLFNLFQITFVFMQNLYIFRAYFSTLKLYVMFDWKTDITRMATTHFSIEVVSWLKVLEVLTYKDMDIEVQCTCIHFLALCYVVFTSGFYLEVHFTKSFISFKINKPQSRDCGLA